MGMVATSPPPQPLPLDSLSFNRARTLDAKRVLVSSLVGKPPHTLNGSTIIGTDAKPRRHRANGNPGGQAARCGR